MSEGLDRTFEVLARTANPAASGILVTALDVRDDRVRSRAVLAILRRRHMPTALEVVRRWPQLSFVSRTLLEKNVELVGPALRHSLLHGEPDLCRNALEILPWLEDFSQVTVLVNLLESSDPEIQIAAEQALNGLLNRLLEYLGFGADPAVAAGRYLRDSARIRHQVVEALDNSSRRFATHQCRLVVEGLLALSRPSDASLKRLFREPEAAAFREAERLLQTSTHPGVLALVVDSLLEAHPLPQAASAFSRRTDPEFLCHLLRCWPRKMTAIQQRNLREIQSLAWLSQRPLQLEVIPPGLHRALVSFLMATGAPYDDKIAAIEWIVRHGSPEGRMAATEILEDAIDERVQGVVMESLESDAKDLQAWATTQLRQREIPGAIEILLERLDSSLPEVRDAARSELSDFNIVRTLEIFESLDPVRARGVGRIVKKIDPDTIAKLKAELASPIQRRRVRAIRCADRVGWLPEVVPDLVLRLDDEDPVVRRTAIAALARFPRVAAEAVPKLLRDINPRVREAARAVLEKCEAVLGTH